MAAARLPPPPLPHHPSRPSGGTVRTDTEQTMTENQPLDLDAFLALVATGERLIAGSPAHQFMFGAAQRALAITAELNGRPHDAGEVRALLSELTGRPVPDSVGVFPPFHSEFGQNLHLGEGVFINIGCVFQDTGGIWIGDRTLVGHNCIFTTLNHGTEPERRGDMLPAPIHIGSDVWVRGAGDRRPGHHHRGRRHHRCRLGRHEGPARPHRRRRRSGARDPRGLRALRPDRGRSRPARPDGAPRRPVPVS